MPYATAARPSIQVALLKAIVDRHGHTCETFHLNLDFVVALEAHAADDARGVYERLCEHRFAAGDWFFARAAFGDDAPDPGAMLDYWRREGELETGTEADLLRIYHEIAPGYIDALVSRIDWAGFDVVGFTSTFQQNAASFALARRIKEVAPSVVTLFGGANFDGTMGPEWVRSMPFVDYAIRGEADESLPAFLDAVASGEDATAVPGVIGRRNGQVVSTEARPVADLDRSPVPDYTEYFERIDELELMHRLEVTIPYESARGCWWGAKRHCTFCGLNGGTMEFRAKSPSRVLDELSQLALDHRVLNFCAVDNIIDTSYFDDLLPELARVGRPFHLFYETKADLTRDQIELLARAGVDSIQPGIESLSSHVLALMRKGTKAIWNVALLRWASYYGVFVHWNIIYGFPGETVDDIAEQVDSCRRLVHLCPPGSLGRVWLERFSPLFEQRDQFPADFVEPNERYRFVYPAHVDLEQAAYFFDYRLENTPPDECYAELGAVFGRWIELSESEEPPTMTACVGEDRTHVVDRRDPDAAREVWLTDERHIVHRACFETWTTPDRLATATGLDRDVVDSTLQWLHDENLTYRDGNLHMALALPAAPAEVRGRRSFLGRHEAVPDAPVDAGS
jgi:ribosomal peptide maturation radical SAM protein 1